MASSLIFTSTRRSRSWFIACCLLVFVLAPAAASADDRGHTFGIGAQFWRTLDDVGDDLLDNGLDNIEDDGYGLLVSWRYEPMGLFFVQVDAQYFDDGISGDGDADVAPVAYIGIGHGWYAAAGIGATLDGNSDSFFAGRIGRNIDLLPGISVDLHANYYADAFEALEDATSDAITLGATVRFHL
ncbi:MAG: hypothetical protein AAGE94_16400 [Acidobacteriota bacterium]